MSEPWTYTAPDTSPLWRVAMAEVFATGFSPPTWLLLPQRISVKPGESLKDLEEKIREEEKLEVRIKVWNG